jgi:hypothetical protein
MAVPQYVYIDASSDPPAYGMIYYTYRRKMAVPQYAYVDGSSDGSSG